MIRKLLAGVSIAAVAALALLLVTVNAQPKSAEAVVASISTTTTTVGDDFYAQLHIVAEDDDYCNPNCSTRDVEVTATAGDFIAYDPMGFVSGCYDDFFQSCAYQVDSNGFGDDGLDGDCDDDLEGPGDTHIAIETTGSDCWDNFNTTEIELWWHAPEGFDGGAVTFCAWQGTSVKCTTIQVLGSPATITLVALRESSNESSSCEGTPVYVIAAVEYDFGPWTTFDNNRAILCADVRDNAGHPLPDIDVIWTVTGGGCLDALVTNTGSNGLTENELTSCSTGNSGDVATVTATAGTATASVKVEFGGNPGSCALVVVPDPLDIGDNAVATVTFKDDLGNKVPDGVRVHFVEVDSGDGADNFAFVTTQEDTVNSMAAAQVIGAISGLTTLAASIEEVAAVDTTCSEALEISGDIHIHPDACPGDPDFILYGNKPPAGGGFGTFAFCGGSWEALLTASGCPKATSAFFYNKPSGTWAVWIPGSEVSAVNAEIMTIFPNEHMPIPKGTIFTAKCK